MRYLVVVEKGPTSYGAYVPDLPGCIAAGETKAEVLTLIREAIEMHLEDLPQEGLSIPPPASTSELVEVEAAEPGVREGRANKRRRLSFKQRGARPSTSTLGV